MSYDKILSFKKQDTKENKVEFVKYLVVGNDLYTLSVLKKLLNENKEVKAICPFEFTEDNARLLGPSTVRGESNLKAMKKLLNKEDMALSEAVPVFFKEQKFRTFGGRSKPEALLFDEEFYSQNYSADFDLKDVEEIASFTSEDIEKIEAARLSVDVKDLQKIDPTDMINNEQWEVACTDGVIRRCEHLIWGKSPYFFLKNYRNKEKLSDEFMQLAETTKNPNTLRIELLFDAPITDKEETLFFPLSYTHDWGHFVGEFKTLESGKQRASFSTFIDEDQANEEIVSKRIRIFKKNLEKIFEKFSQIQYKEFISLTEQTACLKIDDLAFSELKDNLKNLVFVGESALVGQSLTQEYKCEDSDISVSHFARGVLSLKQLPAQ